jgi:hypothetical protein
MKRCVLSRLGSALRLSQPPSGFLATPSFVAFFHATAVPGIPPFRAFPSQRSRTSLEAASSLAVIHRCAETRRPQPYHPRFRRLPRFHAVAWFPPRTMSSLFPSRSSVPGHSGLRTTEPPRSASFTYFEAFLPLRVRSQQPWVAPQCWPVLSWAFASPKHSPSTLWILDPPEHKVRTRPFVRRRLVATERTEALLAG